MKRLIFAAGVAALAITAPAASQPGDRGGGNDRRAEAQKERGEKARGKRAERSEQRAQRAERRGQRADRGERRAQAQERRGQRAERAEKSREQRANRGEKAREQRANRAERVREQRGRQVERSRERRANRAENVREQRANRAERVREQRADRVERGRGQRVERVERVREQRAERLERGRERAFERQNRQLERIAERRGFELERRVERPDRQLARLAERNVIRVSDWQDLARGGVWLEGCPPGLAKKLVPCVPPGQVNNFIGEPVALLGDRIGFRELPARLRYVYADTDDYYYRYGAGYMYRIDRDRDLVRALLPLFGLGLTVGQPFPMSYSNYYLPAGLQPFYANPRCGFDPYGSNDYYRYANGYVYEIDCRTGLVEDVDPLLGYGYGYGQMMPITYSAYNVPYQYRPLYYDTSDYYYRYAPGAIYQVDRSTSLITAVAALLTGGMTIGQPLPLGYNVYNVPYAYRTTYYDRPDAWYRYSNGYIYRVDPTTQLVTAIVASVLT